MMMMMMIIRESTCPHWVGRGKPLTGSQPLNFWQGAWVRRGTEKVWMPGKCPSLRVAKASGNGAFCSGGQRKGAHPRGERKKWSGFICEP